MGQHRLQVLQVEQQQAFLIGNTESDVENAFLRIGKVHQPRQKQRPHFGNGGADRVALLAEQIPENGRKFLIVIRVKADLFGALDQKILLFAHGGDAGQVALDIGGEHRNACVGKGFGQNLQSDGFAGAGRAGDQAVAVGEFQRQIFALLDRVIGLAAGANENLSVLQHGCLFRPVFRVPIKGFS